MGFEMGFFEVFVHRAFKSYLIYSAMFMFRLVGMAHPTGLGLVLSLHYIKSLETRGLRLEIV